MIRRGRRMRLPGLFYHSTNCLYDDVWTVDLNVMSAVPGNDLRPASREVRQFFLHFLPGLIDWFREVRRQVTRGLVGIVREHGQGQVCQ